MVCALLMAVCALGPAPTTSQPASAPAADGPLLPHGAIDEVSFVIQRRGDDGTIAGLWRLRDQLVKLDLLQIDVRDRDLAVLTQFPKLEVLRLPASRLTAEGLRTLAKLPALRDLALYGIEPTVDLSALAGCQALEELDLARAREFWKELDPNWIAGLASVPRLKGLRLHGWVIGRESWVGLARLPRLERLVPFNYRGSPGDPEVMAKLPGLRELDVRRGFIFMQGRMPPPPDDAVVETLARLPRLETLTLECEGLTRTGWEALSRCSRVRYLTLLQPSDAGMEIVAALPDVQTLHLMYGRGLTGAALASIARMKNLRVLSLTDCINMGGARWEDLADSPQLIEVNINWSDTAAPDIQTLLTLRPELRVSIDGRMLGSATTQPAE